MDTSRAVLRLRGHTGRITSLAFSPDGNRLVSSSYDDYTRLWDTDRDLARRSAGEHLRRLRDELRPAVASLFDSSSVGEALADTLYLDPSFSPIERAAALQLALHPPLPPALSARPSSTALVFDTVDSHVLVAEPETLVMLPTFTIEAWVSPRRFGPDTPLGLRTILCKEGEYQLAIDATGQLFWTLAGPRGWIPWSAPRQRLPHEDWTHIALVRDRTEVRIYLNGSLVQQQDVPAELGDHDREMNEFRIGGRQHTASSFRGAISDVRVWSIALSHEQLGQGVSRDAMGLLAAWPFDEGSGIIVRELRGEHPGRARGARWAEK